MGLYSITASLASSSVDVVDDVYHGRQTELLEALDEERSSCIIKASSALP